ncbi:hypothetical protein D3C83_86160 [compost metagenome]
MPHQEHQPLAPDRPAEKEHVLAALQRFNVGQRLAQPQLERAVDDDAPGPAPPRVRHQHDGLAEIGVGERGLCDEEYRVRLHFGRQQRAAKRGHRDHQQHPA